MHVDGSWHSLGAAACAARLAGLDAEGVASAVRLAGCQVPFTVYAPIRAGMDGRNSYAAHAVLLGEMAAAAAAAGMAAPRRGFAEARKAALGLDWPPQTAPLGTWLLEEGYIKPYAGVRHAHYAVAAALALRPNLGSTPHTICIRTYAEAIRYAGNRAPRTAIEAQFSVTWAVAAALTYGDLGPEAYAAAAFDQSGGLHALEHSIRLDEDTALSASGRRGATVIID